MAGSQGIYCEVFEVEEVRVTHREGRPEIHYKLWTDLPAGTLPGLVCYRSYTNWRNEGCVWTMVEDELTIVPDIRGDYNGVVGNIDVIKADIKAKKRFEELLSDLSAGIRTPIGDEIEMIFTVGARQRLKAFGKNNANLTGPLVQEAGGVRYIELSTTVNAPMRRDLQPLRTEDEEEE